jgi:hypothetical protein
MGAIMIAHVVSSPLSSSAHLAASDAASGGQAVRLVLMTGALLLLIAAVRKLARAVTAMLAAAANLGTVAVLVVLCVVMLGVALLHPLV